MLTLLRNIAGVILLIILILLGVSVAGLAHAQGAPRCGSLADVLASLYSSFHERIIWEGEAKSGLKMVLTAAPDGSTWTALLVDGTVACLFSAGIIWEGKLGPAGEDI